MIVRSLSQDIINPQQKTFEIVPLPYCKIPEEDDRMTYWKIIKQLVFSRIAPLMTANKEEPINIIYIAGYKNNPHILFKHLDASFKAETSGDQKLFHVGNTPNAVYEWFEFEHAH